MMSIGMSGLMVLGLALMGADGGQKPPPQAKVRTFPVVERNRWIWIWMGDPERADEALVPDFHWNDDPDWLSVGDRYHVRGNYRLLVEERS